MANNEDIVKTLAKMVNVPLTVEFEKRDKAIFGFKERDGYLSTEFAGKWE